MLCLAYKLVPYARNAIRYYYEGFYCFNSRALSPSIAFIHRIWRDSKMAQQAQPRQRKTIRRDQLRELVPLADTTIYEMERRGEFPARFYLTSRCVVWDLAEVEDWLEARKRASTLRTAKRAPMPDVRLRTTRPVKRQEPA